MKKSYISIIMFLVSAVLCGISAFSFFTDKSFLGVIFLLLGAASISFAAFGFGSGENEDSSSNNSKNKSAKK